MASPEEKESAEEWGQQDDRPRERAGSLGEIAKVLEVKRWQTQREPFRGFNSPPGRF